MARYEIKKPLYPERCASCGSVAGRSRDDIVAFAECLIEDAESIRESPPPLDAREGNLWGDERAGAVVTK